MALRDMNLKLNNWISGCLYTHTSGQGASPPTPHLALTPRWATIDRPGLHGTRTGGIVDDQVLHFSNLISHQ